MSPETYYEILGVGEDADDDAVKQAFRDLAKHFHPDRNPNDQEAERQFKRINTAYEGLKDASRRQAYNEWLEFAEKRDKVKRTQWGRLGALVFLLLIGPSAVLYWAVVIADIPLFADKADKTAGPAVHRETSLPPPRPEKRQPLTSDAPSPVQETAVQSPPATAPVTPPPPQAAEPAAAPPPAAVTTEVKQPPVAPRPEPARNVANADRNGAAPPAGPAPPARKPGPEEKTSTQALPAPSSLSEAAGDEDPASREARLGNSDEDRGDQDGAQDLAQRQGQAQNRDPAGQNSGARDTARMLARLKEPEGAQSGTAIPSETVPPGLGDAAPQSRNGLPADAFSDCDECPVISAAGGNQMLGGNSRAAVSLTEITLADWDGCVADRACPPIDRAPRGSRRETVVEVGPREAEAYANWLSATSGKNYRHIMSPRRRELAAQRCNGARRNNSGWEWLDDDAARNCPPASDAESDGPRAFRVFRRIAP